MGVWCRGLPLPWWTCLGSVLTKIAWLMLLVHYATSGTVRKPPHESTSYPSGSNLVSFSEKYCSKFGMCCCRNYVLLVHQPNFRIKINAIL